MLDFSDVFVAEEEIGNSFLMTKGHNHVPSPNLVDELELSSSCKRRAEEETGSLRHIFDQERARYFFKL